MAFLLYCIPMYAYMYFVFSLPVQNAYKQARCGIFRLMMLMLLFNFKFICGPAGNNMLIMNELSITFGPII
jgi:hypothetical protein